MELCCVLPVSGCAVPRPHHQSFMIKVGLCSCSDIKAFCVVPFFYKQEGGDWVFPCHIEAVVGFVAVAAVSRKSAKWRQP